MANKFSSKSQQTDFACKQDVCKNDQACEPIRRYAALNDKACDGIFSLSLNGKILYANQKARKQFQLPLKKSLEGISFSALVDPTCLNKINDMIKSVVRGEEVNLLEFNALGLKGVSFPAEIIVSPDCVNGKVKEIYVLIRNISNRRNYEELLKESERRKAMHAVLVGTTQEIVNPLQVLLNSADGIIDKYAKRDFEYIGYKEYKEIFNSIDTIRNQVKQCLRLSNNLIALNKRKVGIKAELCSVNKTIKEVISFSLLQLNDDSLKVSLDLGKNLPKIAVGQIEFRQIIESVFLNAAQSVMNRGRVTIKTRFLTKSNVVRIDCKDNGVGIPQDILERIFEPFFSTKQQGTEKSAGLGLTIVHGLVRAFKGDIVIKSDLNQGTLVSIFFPIVKMRKKKCC